MAPGSRVVRAVFSHFFGEDSGQTRDATGELRVASRSWSCSLSQGSKLADQLAGICARRQLSERKNASDFQRVSPIFVSFCAHG